MLLSLTTKQSLCIEVPDAQARCVIKFVNDLRQIRGFLRELQFPPPIKLTSLDMTLSAESGVKHNSPIP